MVICSPNGSKVTKSALVHFTPFKVRELPRERRFAARNAVEHVLAWGSSHELNIKPIFFPQVYISNTHVFKSGAGNLVTVSQGYSTYLLIYLGRDK